MDWQAVAVIVAMATFVLSLVFQNWRDRQNKLRDIRLRYLIDSYQLITTAVNRKPDEREVVWDSMERVVADIQLFGTEHQIELAQGIANAQVDDSQSGLDSLINELRADLRRELGLSSVDGNVLTLRFDRLS